MAAALYKNWSLDLIPGTTQYQAKAVLNNQILSSPSFADQAAAFKWIDGFPNPVQVYTPPVAPIAPVYPQSQYASSVMGTPQPAYPSPYAQPGYPQPMYPTPLPGASPYNPAPMVDATAVQAAPARAPHVKKPLWKQPVFIVAAAALVIGAFSLFRGRR